MFSRVEATLSELKPRTLVPQGNIGQIEFFLCFQDFFSLQIISRTAVKQICLFQFIEITVNSFVVEGAPFGFQIIGNRLCGKGVADIVEGVFHNALQLVDLPNLIPFTISEKIVELYISRTIVWISS